MNYYDISCKLDTIQNRLECFSEMIGVLAENTPENRESGLYWFIYDTIQSYSRDVGSLSEATMANHLEEQEKQFKAEKKKNANKAKK
jgi:hypothetical protein